MPSTPKLRLGQKTAMISGTSLDLPEHRKQVIEACVVAFIHLLWSTCLAATLTQ